MRIWIKNDSQLNTLELKKIDLVRDELELSMIDLCYFHDKDVEWLETELKRYLDKARQNGLNVYLDIMCYCSDCLDPHIHVFRQVFLSPQWKNRIDSSLLEKLKR